MEQKAFSTSDTFEYLAAAIEVCANVSDMMSVHVMNASHRDMDNHLSCGLTLLTLRLQKLANECSDLVNRPHVGKAGGQ